MSCDRKILGYFDAAENFKFLADCSIALKNRFLNYERYSMGWLSNFQLGTASTAIGLKPMTFSRVLQTPQLVKLPVQSKIDVYTKIMKCYKNLYNEKEFSC